MKKVLTIVMALMIALLGFAGCGDNAQAPAQDTGDDGAIQIVATIFPEYDWVRTVLGDNPAGAEVTLLLDSGVDLHSYQPTAADMLKISTCDMFIYVGGESDAWVDDAMAQRVNADMKVLNLMDIMGDAAKEEEVVEGMQAEEEEGEEAEEEEGPEYDEHVWLSLRNAQVFVNEIAKSLGEVDPDNAMYYQGNADMYNDELRHLDADYIDVFAFSSRSHLVFGDRFPFRYLFDDYSMDYYAAFVGCSAETEASFETITFLAGKVDELGLKSVLTIEGADHRLAETIVNNTTEKNQRILTLNSMQSISTADISNGATYLEIMRDNLDVFKTALQY